MVDSNSRQRHPGTPFFKPVDGSVDVMPFESPFIKSPSGLFWGQIRMIEILETLESLGEDSDSVYRLEQMLAEEWGLA